MLSGRAQGSLESCSCFHLPGSQLPFSDTINPGSLGSSVLYKDSSHTTKKTQPSYFIRMFREGTCRPCTPSRCQCHGVREVQLEVEMRGTRNRKASSWASPSKRVFTSCHHVFSFVPDNPLETLRCWLSTMPSTHSAAELKGRWVPNVHQ